MREGVRLAFLREPTGIREVWILNPAVRRDYERLFDDLLPRYFESNEAATRALDRAARTGRSRWWNELLELSRQIRHAAEAKSREAFVDTTAGEPPVDAYYHAHDEAEQIIQRKRRMRVPPSRLGQSPAPPTRGRPKKTTAVRDEELVRALSSLAPDELVSCTAAARALRQRGLALSESTIRQRLGRLIDSGVAALR